MIARHGGAIRPAAKLISGADGAPPLFLPSDSFFSLFLSVSFSFPFCIRLMCVFGPFPSNCQFFFNAPRPSPHYFEYKLQKKKAKPTLSSPNRNHRSRVIVTKPKWKGSEWVSEFWAVRNIYANGISLGVPRVYPTIWPAVWTVRLFVCYLLAWRVWPFGADIRLSDPFVIQSQAIE